MLAETLPALYALQAMVDDFSHMHNRSVVSSGAAARAAPRADAARTIAMRARTQDSSRHEAPSRPTRALEAAGPHEPAL